MNGVWTIPGAQAVAWSLVHFLWQGTLVAGGLAAGLALSRGRSAQLRYALAAGALLAMLVLPVATALRLSDATSRAVAVQEPPALQPVEARDTAPSPWTFRATAGGFDPAPSLRARLDPWLPAIFIAWLAGVALLSLWNLGGWLQARRLTSRDARPAPPAWQARLADLRERLKVGRGVRLLESARAAVPSMVGWLRPVILVPASAFSGLSPRQLEAVLAHELAHVRRHDYVINLLQALVETVLFYHPAVWWASRQMRIERENCCDDVALGVCGDRLGYARALATLEGLRMPASALAANGGSLLARIRRVVGAPASARPNGWLTGALVLALLSAGAFVQRGGLSAADAGAGTTASPAPPAPHASSPRLAPPAPLPPLPPAPPAPALSEISINGGHWIAERRKDGIQLEIQVHEDTFFGRHDMQESSLYAEKDLVGFGPGPDARFEMRRAAGTFHFIGHFTGAKGEGTFTFKGNPGYVQEMASLGLKVKTGNLIQLALSDVSPAFVRELRDYGYANLPLDRIVEFRIHGVDMQFIRDLVALGYRDIPVERLVELRIHGVKPDLVRALQELEVAGLTPETIIELQIHGASPDYLRQMASAGYKGLSSDDVVQLRIHGISPEYVRELAALGYPRVSADDLVNMSIHGVTADFIREQKKRSRNLSVRELIDLRIHGGRWR